MIFSLFFSAHSSLHPGRQLCELFLMSEEFVAEGREKVVLQTEGEVLPGDVVTYKASKKEGILINADLMQ